MNSRDRASSKTGFLSLQFRRIFKQQSPVSFDTISSVRITLLTAAIKLPSFTIFSLSFSHKGSFAPLSNQRLFYLALSPPLPLIAKNCSVPSILSFQSPFDTRHLCLFCHFSRASHSSLTSLISPLCQVSSFTHNHLIRPLIFPRDQLMTQMVFHFWRLIYILLRSERNKT